MFRSRRRPVVFPQAEHARVAGELALVYGNERVPPPPLPRGPFVTGVALHDRGYGQLDADGIGEVPAERWVAIQRASFTPRGQDAVVDLVIALHVRRLLDLSPDPRAAAAAAELDATLPGLREAAGVSAVTAAEADLVTNLCDRVAFDLCVEEPASGEVGGIRYAVDGSGGVTLDPWPLGVPRLDALLVGFEADGYPARLEPVPVPFSVKPGSR